MRIQQAFGNLQKYRKIYITLAVVFFGLAAAVQITAIKLAGGFFYCREIAAAPAACVNYAGRHYFFKQSPSPVIGAGRQLLSLLRFQRPAWFYFSGCLFFFLGIFLYLIALPRNILPPVNFYGRAGIYVRPPTVF